MEINIRDLIELFGEPVFSDDIKLSAPLGTISTDSRTFKKGNFYIPLVGENFDGHDFLDEIFKKGAQAAIVSKNYSGSVPSPLPHWVVSDTLYAYQQIALLHRRKLNLPVVAITGSVGKTTTRELIRATLSPLGNVVSSRENENNDIGVPKTLLRCSSEDSAIVLEMGMRGLGQIERLSHCSEPDVAVITNIGHAHLGLLGSRDNIARAKSEITSNLKPDGVLIIPFGDHLLEKALKVKWSGRIIRVAIKDYSLDWVGDNDNSFASKDTKPDYIAQIDIQNNLIVLKGNRFFLPLEGRHNAMNYLMALAVADELGVPKNNLNKSDLKMPLGRNRLVSCGPFVVLDESYNASPDSVIASLELLRSKPGRHFAVFGTMLELGEDSNSLHEKIVKKAVEFGLEGMVFVSKGDEANFIKNIIKELPFHDIVSTPEQAGKLLLSWLTPGDIVLIKGSRELRLERIIPILDHE